jgi:hypothetical protein
MDAAASCSELAIRAPIRRRNTIFYPTPITLSPRKPVPGRPIHLGGRLHRCLTNHNYRAPTPSRNQCYAVIRQKRNKGRGSHQISQHRGSHPRRCSDPWWSQEFRWEILPPLPPKPAREEHTHVRRALAHTSNHLTEAWLSRSPHPSSTAMAENGRRWCGWETQFLAEQAIWSRDRGAQTLVLIPRDKVRLGGPTRQARRAVATDSEGSEGGHELVAWEKELTAGPRLLEGVRPRVVRRAGQKWMRAAIGQGPHMPVSRAIAGVRLGWARCRGD